MARGRKARKKGGRRISLVTIGYIISFLVIVSLVIFLILPVFQPAGGTARPRPGDHWHASYSIVVCGKTLPSIPVETPGGVHTHGDGLLHIHPTGPAESGPNANLERFFSTAGGAITEGTLRLPSGERYANGDLCPDGKPGRLSLAVNGREVRPIATYAPQDGDGIVITFGSE